MFNIKHLTFATALFATLGLTACQSVPTQTPNTPVPTTKSQYQHIRNATAKINYAGKTFLVDPYLAEKGRYLAPNATIRNPLIDLTQSIEEILSGVDAVIVTHTHLDHWDEVAQEVIPKDLPIFVQNPGDARLIREQGFTDVRVMGKNTPFGDVKLTRTRGQHGTDEMYSDPKIAEMVGDAMGVVFQAKGKPTIYLAGDTIYNHEIAHNLRFYQPDFIVLNAGYAKIPNFEGSPIMGLADVARIHNDHSTKAIIATVHMDALPQTAVSSSQMREFVKHHDLTRVIVPKSGDIIQLDF